MKKWADIFVFNHIAKRSDGKVFKNGEEVSDVVPEINNNSGVIEIRDGFIDELLVSPGMHSVEEIKAWYNQTLPLQRSATGYRIMPELDLSYVEEIEEKTFIKWFEEIKENTDITVEVSFDGGNNWHECTNGGEIPELVDEMDVSTTTMLVKQTLESTDGVRTPIFKTGTQIDITGPKDSVVSFSEVAE